MTLKRVYGPYTILDIEVGYGIWPTLSSFCLEATWGFWCDLATTWIWIPNVAPTAWLWHIPKGLDTTRASRPYAGTLEHSANLMVRLLFKGGAYCKGAGNVVNEI